MTDKIAVISSLILTSIIIFDATSVIAGPPVSPRSASKFGEIVETVIKKFSGEAAGAAGAAVGTAAAKSIIDSGKPYVLYRTVTWYDGRNYNVCQNFQNGRPISAEYWCP